MALLEKYSDLMVCFFQEILQTPSIYRGEDWGSSDYENRQKRRRVYLEYIQVD